MSDRGRRGLLPVALAGLLLGGCASDVPATDAADPTSTTPSAAPTEPSTPTATPTAEPAVDTVRFTIDGVDFVAAGAIVERFDWFSDASGVIDALTDSFGAAPVVTPYAPLEDGPFTIAEWPGLALTDPESAPESPWFTDYWVAIDAPEIAGVTLETVDGIGVGTPFAAVAERGDAGPEQTDYPFDRADGTRFEGGLSMSIGATSLPDREEGFPYVSDQAGFVPELAVWVQREHPSDAVTAIVLPSPNWGPGHGS